MAGEQKAVVLSCVMAATVAVQLHSVDIVASSAVSRVGVGVSASASVAMEA